MQKAIDNLFSKYEGNKDFVQEVKDNNLSLEEFKKEVENENNYTTKNKRTTKCH